MEGDRGGLAAFAAGHHDPQNNQTKRDDMVSPGGFTEEKR